jgi:methanogenic corrinoid protein MtbC1
MSRLLMNISAVERETGVLKDTLRMWERRYGFPQPERDDGGERGYPLDQVEKIRLIKRLMSKGWRPGKLMSLPDEELAALTQPLAVAEAEGDQSALQSGVLDQLRKHDAGGLRDLLRHDLHSLGLQQFVLDKVPMLNRAVGEAWERGEIQVFEEHLYTELMQATLRQAIGALPPASGRPRLLLTTVPEEQHVLGLLMIEALMTLEGATCISLGTQTPLADICRAAEAQQADIVALSFSAAFPSRQAGPLIGQLRSRLPGTIELWVGGAGVARHNPAGRRAPDEYPAGRPRGPGRLARRPVGAVAEKKSVCAIRRYGVARGAQRWVVSARIASHLPARRSSRYSSSDSKR